MAYNYASNEALQALVTKVEALLATKVDTEVGKGLSTNDLTAELKQHYDAAYTHSQAAHAPADAEKNVIVAVTFNGSPVEIDGPSRTAKIVATIPSKVSDLQNDSKFQTDTQVSASIASALENYYDKDTADTKIAQAVQGAAHLKYQIVDGELPVSDQDPNTIYMVAHEEESGPDGQDTYVEYMWINNKWEIIGDTRVDLTNYYTKSQTDEKITEMLASYVLKSDMVEITGEQVQAMFSDAE